MIKISRLADYAVVILAAMETSSGEQMTAGGLARVTNLPEPTVAKTLKLLAGENLVGSIRGASGGYKLVQPFEKLTIADVITAIDGPIALTACVDTASTPCDFQSSCAVKGRWNKVNNAVNDALKNIPLTEMVRRAA